MDYVSRKVIEIQATLEVNKQITTDGRPEKWNEMDNGAGLLRFQGLLRF